LSRVSSEKSGAGEDAEEDGDDADEGGGGSGERQLVLGTPFMLKSETK